MAKRHREIIAVRSLTGSDLGLFAAHRSSARSKQRAININSSVAARLLSPAVFRSGGSVFDCFCTFGDVEDRSTRHLGKVHKNWRLGGNKFEGAAFGAIDNLDFALIRSMEANDGKLPLSVTFICRATRSPMHARLVSIASRRLRQSMAVYDDDEEEFRFLASLCPVALLPKNPPL
ncbi:MAG TPA: hypothetical protein VG889_14130 [Rhizomicrobium sp.]|nr:hypothetical protein [Rhizomicrobium sp.]